MDIHNNSILNSYALLSYLFTILRLLRVDRLFVVFRAFRLIRKKKYTSRSPILILKKYLNVLLFFFFVTLK